MSVETKAAIVRKPAGPMTIEDVTIDSLRDNEILVRIAGTGLCHTDLVFAAGLTILKPPAVFGHEGAGIVEKIGDAVAGVSVGDHVVMTFNSCGNCVRCESGHPAYCLQFPAMNYGSGRADGSCTVHVGDQCVSANFFGQSSFAGYAIGNERNVVPIDKDVPIELMGALGCGVQTGAGSVMNAMACPEGSTLVILGGGAVGLSAVLGGAIQGCSTIIVIEPKPSRREMALELGATHVIDPADGDVVAAVREIVTIGVDFIFDTTGIPDLLTQSIQMLAPLGTLGIVGISNPIDASLPLPINQMVGAGFRVMGIIEGDVDPHEFIPRMVSLYREGRFPFDKLLKSYKLEDINEAIADQHAGQCIKPVLIP